MEHKSQNVICQNCKKDFTIEPEDFSFYEKISVPPPTWCPECRMKRRMLFRNERSLYKQNCGLCKKSVISMYNPKDNYTVYCNDCYISDKWDPLSYGKDYDFSKKFFEQLGELFKSVPRRALYQDFAVNSEYINQIVNVKNSYLCFGGRDYEDCNYCAQNFFIKNCLDVDFSKKSEFCFESAHLRNCSRVKFGYYSEDCLDSWLIYACKNCSNCIGCTNLVSKSYCIFNRQYTKEEYEKKLKEMNLTDPESLEKVKKEFWEHSLNFPRKYASVRNAVNSIGDDIEQVKNCKYVFSVSEAENVRYSFFVPYGGAKDSFDLDHVGVGTTETYELHSGFGNNRVMFGNRVYYSHNVEYSDDCYNSEYLFACAGLRKKQYCILNKQYSKEDFEKLRTKIIEQMKEIVYTDKKGRIFSYGEFFPMDIMPFGYNDAVVHEYFSLTEGEILEKGYKYTKPENRNYKPTILSHQLPSVEKANENVLKEIIQCEHMGNCNDRCTMAFRITQNELNILKVLNAPLPRLCPNCRHMERIRLINSPRLYHRKCMKEECNNEFETPYAPDRPEIVYCESCYNKEVY